MQTGYYEIGIRSHHAGFGMFQLGEKFISPEYVFSDERDLLANCSDEYLPLDDALQNPEFQSLGVKDIRGKIYGGDPAQIYVILREHNDKKTIEYFGIDETEVPDNFWD